MDIAPKQVSASFVALLIVSIFFRLFTQVLDAQTVNSALLCVLAQEYSAGDELLESCFSGSAAVVTFGSPTVAAYLGERQFLQRQLVSCEMTECGCEVAGYNSNNNEGSDIQLELLRTYHTAATLLQSDKPLLLTAACMTKFPPSVFLWRRSRDYRKQGLDEESAALVELAYRLDNGWTTPVQRGEAALEQAESYRTRGHLALSEKAYRRVLETYRGQESEISRRHVAQAYLGLGKLAAEQGNIEESRAAFEQGMLASPTEAGELAAAYVQSLQAYPVAAHRPLLAPFVLERANGDARLVYHLVVALVNADMMKEGKWLIEVVPRAGSDSIYLAAANAYLQWKDGNLEGARSLFKKVTEKASTLDSENASDWLFYLGEIEEARGNLSAAIGNFQESVLLKPERKWIWYRLAQLYETRGERLAARHAIVKALALDPDNEAFRRLEDELSSP